jgi:uncharacterized protein YbjT (DUF2867 family)
VRDAFDDGVELVPFDFGVRQTFRRALDGVRAVFLLRPPAISKVEATLHVLIDHARQAGVEHVVFLSVAGAEKAKFIPHAKVEAHLRRSGIAWTFLRAGFFAQNLGDAYRRDIVDDDRILLPAGRAAASFVDVRDVGEVAARSLVEGTLLGEAPELVGPEALDFEQVAACLSDVLGRTIRYDAVSVPRYLFHLRRQGDPWSQALVKTALHVGLRFGQGLGDGATLEGLLGRRPGNLRSYLQDHRELWQRDPRT